MIKRKRKMTKKKRVLHCIVSLAVAIMLLNTSMPTVNAAAADEEPDQEVEVLEAEAIVLEEDVPATRTLISDWNIDIKSDSDGLVVEVRVGTMQKASVIGVKDIKIYKKMWYGWKLVAISDGDEALDCVKVVVTAHYGNAEKGSDYKATCVCYANVDGLTEKELESHTFSYS